jgi:flagellin-like protein
MKGMKGISAVIATILMLVITIALAGTAYMYISGIFTTQTQGIEVLDAYCVSAGVVNVNLRNLGTNAISSITCSRTSPTAGNCTEGTNGIIIKDIAPGGSSGSFKIDTCTDTGSRFCQYRLTPNTGRTITTQVSCS